MTALEIILLLLGVSAFALSFFLPGDTKTADAETKKLIEREAKEAISKEVDDARGKLAGMVEDTVNEAVEKTERSLEKVSNQKIMAVNEYSDTVLADIGKNHKEVMFLYDMLSDKQKSIQTAVSQAEETVKKKTREAAKEEAVPSQPEKAAKTARARKKETAPAKTPSKESAETQESTETQESAEGNSNDRILRLHEEGESDVAIAKALGLGVGEVKLVIDLFQKK